MTTDFRQLILKYMLGQLDEQQASDDLNWGDVKTTQNNLYTYLQEFFNGQNWYITGSMQGTSTTNPLGFTVLYGYYGLAGETKGFLTILDEKFNPLSTLTSYNTGTDFYEFYALNVDEDGNFYGIDRTDTQYRLVLLNNFLVKSENADYEVRLRNSYYFPDDYLINKISRINKIYKRIGSATYLVPFLNGGYNSGYPSVLEIKINVGSENEWTPYQSSFNYTSAVVEDMIFQYTNDTLNYRIALTDISNEEIDEITYNGTSYSKNTYSYSGDVVYLNYDDLYICKNQYPSSSSSGGQIYIMHVDVYKVDRTNNSLINIYSSGWSYYDYGINDKQGIYLFKSSNELFALVINGGSDLSEYRYQLLKIVDEKVYQKNLGYVPSTAVYLNLFFVSKQYNLYSYYIQSQNTVYQVNQIYNELNYNGDSYEDINSLFPNTGNLYSDNQLIFSRGLYNKVVNGNTTTSTIEVPNTLLNDTNITSEELVSHTSTSLVKENQSISKNIYELLYINFINSLIVQNRNSSSYQDMPTIASALNQSICSTLNYDDIKLTKWRITFSDNSTKIGTLTTTKVSDYAYNLKFIFYTSKDIKSIELISNDENVVYLTINELNLSLNKIYKISQNVEVI